VSAAENLKRWKESSRPRAWVEAHNGEWTHADWLSLTVELKRSEYWPLELADVGGVLEELKSQWHDHQMQVEVLIEEAEAALEEGDLDQAVADCTEAMKLGPKGNKTAWLVRALLTRARAYLGKKDHDRAASDASEAARLDPGNREALTVRDDARRGWEGPREAGRADAVNSNKTKQLTTTISLAIDLACDSIISSRADALNVLCKASGSPLPDLTTPEEIQRAYGLAATKYYPANNPGDDKAERRFRHVEAAWAFLQAEKVIAESSETLRANPRSPLAFYQRAEAHFRTGDLDRAIADCTEALRLDRTLFCAYGVRGTAWKRKGQHDKALADLNEALTWNPAYALAFQSRGDTYRLLGRYDQAVADCDQAIRLDPRFSWAFATRGAALRERKEYHRALADLNEALRLNPIYGWAYAERGEVYRLRGEHDRAMTDFDEAIRLDPNHAWAFSRRGAAYWGKGDHDRAVVDCTEAIRLNSADSFAFAIRGDAYRLKRDKDQALKDFTEAIRLDPRNSWALSRRGEEYRARGDLKQALADLTEALRLNPDDVLAAHAKALVEEELQPPRQHQPKAQESVVRPCPGCQKPLRVAQENLGKQVKCPTCGQTFVAEGHERATGDERPASEAGTASPPRRKLPAHSVDQRPDCKDCEGTMTGQDTARCHTCGLTWKLLPSGKLTPADPKRCEFCGTVMTVEDFKIQDSPDLPWASVGVACKTCGAEWHWARAGHWQTHTFPTGRDSNDSSAPGHEPAPAATKGSATVGSTLTFTCPGCKRAAAALVTTDSANNLVVRCPHCRQALALAQCKTCSTVYAVKADTDTNFSCCNFHGIVEAVKPPLAEAARGSQQAAASPAPTNQGETPSEAAEWYCLSSGQQYGPVSWTQLRQWATAGNIRPTDQVWKVGTPGWVPASTVAGLVPESAGSAALEDRILEYARMREFDLAISVANELLQQFPTLGRAYYLRGMMFFIKQDYGRAIADFKEAVRFEPSNPEYGRRLAEAGKARKASKRGGFWKGLANLFMDVCDIGQALAKGTKTCPHCMRAIDVGASVCPYCTRDHSHPRF
jgi:tetratricopeptide (TPR) repeat protein